jgi:hypothetical protein
MGSMLEVYIARGSEENIRRSIVDGVDKGLVESKLGIQVPREAVDSYGNVHLWGVPSGGYAEKQWRSMKDGDLLLIIPTVRRGVAEHCYVTVVVGKYPMDGSNRDFEKALELSKLIWKPYRRRQGFVSEYPYLVFVNSRVRVESFEEIIKILNVENRKSITGYRGSVVRVNPRKINREALQKLVSKVLTTPEKSLLQELIEETYLELSAKHGWHPLNCYWYSLKYNVCYGAPIFLGGREVWGKEGLFEELNRKLVKRGYTDITWDYFRDIMKSIEIQGIIWVNWFIAPNGKVEPHDITIMKPVFLRH